MNTKEYHSAVNNFSDGVYRFALKLSKDDALAKDLVQDAFEKIWIKKGSIEAKKVKSYLFKTVFNQFLDGKKRNKVVSIEEYHSEPMFHQESCDLKDVLNMALATLPPVQKSAILLRDYEGYNYDEIGEVLDLNPSQVKVYIYRARKQLQKYIGKLESVI
ncbi:RNA polymerase sigma factor [Brumimicrobium mesophilum]|uniref:RNA polymerase sigma factor n=1 Tax=Brumimicrobium mesophilum TaxID=392717 RepID=UPI000D1418D1|nr:RNA polymerase sigma factor [Brumimicrobium mesophilum]